MSTEKGHINRRSFVAIGAAGSIGVPVQAAARDGAADPWASDFTNRQSFVRAVRDGLNVADGGCVITGPLAYRAKIGAHAIGDLPGWLPLFDVFANHFGQNNISGETDMIEAINQAIAYVDA